MKKHQNIKGFAHQGLLLLLVVVAVIAAVGYRVATHNNTSNTSTTTSTTTSAAPSKISSKSDVRQASKALDADKGSSQLDPAQLDSYLNQLL